ncbi:MAG: hypothetical protein K9J37_17245 [Saprospiraceae bacterium]|nr:hypothetical protein [Saprospiraceae bacterium]MCF8251663.1 hypothetical protein [Saprospiraceae bacterium]MCF8281073.1 hypothetical protein [Bacteroidales bacterium]MCF8313282.1 hypothetical protein [Saprospiraceae bacterium]MCF8442026.1 hypothetical protein [Saprospiraceae bacterium]
MKKPPPSAIRLRGVRYPTAAAIPPKVWLDVKLLRLEKSLKIKAHNIHGFGWGNDCKGAAQLALAICLELYAADVAMQVAPHFRVLFLDELTGENFDVNLNLTPFNEVHLSQMV